MRKWNAEVFRGAARSTERLVCKALQREGQLALSNKVLWSMHVIEYRVKADHGSKARSRIETGGGGLVRDILVSSWKFLRYANCFIYGMHIYICIAIDLGKD